MKLENEIEQTYFVAYSKRHKMYLGMNLNGDMYCMVSNFYNPNILNISNRGQLEAQIKGCVERQGFSNKLKDYEIQQLVVTHKLYKIQN